MPTTQEYRSPEVFHEYKGVKIYHAYEEGDFECPWKARFSTTVDGSDDSDDKCQFDVRNLPDFDGNDHPPFLVGDDNTTTNKVLWERWHETGQEEAQYKRAIELAIDRGLIQVDMEVDPNDEINCFRSKLADFVKATIALNDAWMLSGGDIGSQNYPFKEDFGELTADIKAWAKTTNFKPL